MTLQQWIEKHRWGRIFSPAGAICTCLVAWLGAWIAIIIGTTKDHEFPLFIPIGLSLGVMAIASFGGFFFTGLDPAETARPTLFQRTRLAITASFVVLYFGLITYLLVMPAFRTELLSDPTPPQSGADSAKLLGASGGEILRNFSWLVGAIVGFYFLSTLGEKVAEKVTGAPAEQPANKDNETT